MQCVQAAAVEDEGAKEEEAKKKKAAADKKLPLHVRQMQERLAKLQAEEERKKREEEERQRKEEEVRSPLEVCQRCTPAVQIFACYFEGRYTEVRRSCIQSLSWSNHRTQFPAAFKMSKSTTELSSGNSGAQPTLSLSATLGGN
jgi:hypothetical protein